MDYFVNESETLENSSSLPNLTGEFKLPVIPKWGFWVKFLTTPIIVFVGIIGNTLSFIIMQTKPLRRKSYSHYLCSLAVFDTLTLVIRQVESVDEYLVSFQKTTGVFQDFDSMTCKFYNFIVHVITLMSSWLVVFMSVERLVAVCFPFKNFALRKEIGAVIAIGVLFIVTCATQSFRFIMIEHVIYDDQRNIRDCLAKSEYLEIYTSLHVYFFLWTLVFLVPAVIIVICNSCVLFHVFKVKKDLQRAENIFTFRNDRSRGARLRSTWMLLIVTFTYILTLMPLFTLSFIVDLTIKVGSLEAARGTYNVLRPYIDVSVSLSMLNYGANFFIYVLSGKRFRFELKKLFYRRRVVKRSFTARSTREEYLRQ